MTSAICFVQAPAFQHTVFFLPSINVTLLHPIMILEHQSHKSSYPLWDAAPSAHSPPPSVTLRCVRFTSSPKASSLLCFMSVPGALRVEVCVTKSSSLHVNEPETVAPAQRPYCQHTALLLSQHLYQTCPAGTEIKIVVLYIYQLCLKIHVCH